MKKIWVLLFFLLSLCANSQAQSGASLSIEDHYQLISSDFFMCDIPGFDDSRASRRSLLRIIDKKHAYLEAQLTNVLLSLALYKDKSTKEDVLVISLTGGISSQCNAIDLRIYERTGEWESGSERFPQEEIQRFLLSASERAGRKILPEYHLQQFSSTIEVIEFGTANKLFDLKWDGQRFYLVVPVSGEQVFKEVKR